MKKFVMLLVILAVTACLAGLAYAQMPGPSAKALSRADLIKMQKERLAEAINYSGQQIDSLNFMKSTLVAYQKTKPTVAWADKISGWIDVCEEAIAIAQAQRDALIDFLKRADLIPDAEIVAMLNGKVPAGYEKRADLVQQQMNEEVMNELVEFVQKQQERQ